MRRQQGFTLIELLVVIAIIGILSAVVLASLGTARNKGNDAAIQSDLSTIQTQAEIYFSGVGNNTYGPTYIATGSCPASGTSMFYADVAIRNAIAGAKTANGGTTLNCNNAANAYAVSSKLQAGVSGKMYWCVDSSGNATAETNPLAAGATVCP